MTSETRESNKFCPNFGKSGPKYQNLYIKTKFVSLKHHQATIEREKPFSPIQTERMFYALKHIFILADKGFLEQF